MEEVRTYSEDKHGKLSKHGKHACFPTPTRKTTVHANYLVILLEAYLHFLFAETSLQKIYMMVGNDIHITSILHEGKYKLVIFTQLKTFLPVPIQKTLAQGTRNTAWALSAAGIAHILNDEAGRLG